MKYDNITPATFIKRLNRFVATVSLNDAVETVHVKNTGRCRELLLPGAEVFLTAPWTPGRKTRYDLITVKKSNGLLINIDSQAPNKAAAEWLRKQPFDRIIPEYTFGDSRIDFYMEKDGHRFLMEVKGCTLERDFLKILLIRHGEPDYAIDSLTEKGWREAELLSKRLSSMRIDDFFVSPLGRAQDTARATLSLLNRKAEVLDWLQEFRGTVLDPKTGERSYAWDFMPQYVRQNKTSPYSREPVREVGRYGGEGIIAVCGGRGVIRREAHDFS